MQTEGFKRVETIGNAESLSLAKTRSFSVIEPEPLRWRWRGRVPSGKLTLFAGDPGLGKSLLTVDIAARTSTGTPFADGSECEQASVLLLSAEDDPSDTIRPRLDAAGADVSRVHLFDAVRNFTADGKSIESGFNLERDISALEDALKRTKARLLIIDPISAYMGGADSHTNADVRGLLAPLASLAGKHGLAVIAVTHLRKSAGAAIYRAMGSLAFAAAARAVWGIVADPDDKARRLFVPVKQNLAPDQGGLAYRIEAPDGVARIAWEFGEIAIDPNQLMGGFETHEDHTERREASEWLKDFLRDGPVAASEVVKAANAQGIAKTTLWRAADSAGVVKRKMGGRGAGWMWSLRESESKNPPQHSVCVDSLNSLKKTNELGESKNPKIPKNPPNECLESVESLPLADDAREVTL